MKPSKKCKMHLVCFDDKERSINGIYCDSDKIVATNGSLLVIKQMKVDKKLKGKIIPAQAWKEYCKGKRTKDGDDEIIADKKKIIVKKSYNNYDIVFEPPKSIPPYPDYKALFEPVQKERNNNTSITVALRPKLLFDLMMAMGYKDKSVLLHITDKYIQDQSAAIPVTIQSDDSVEGLIMPCRKMDEL